MNTIISFVSEHSNFLVGAILILFFIHMTYYIVIMLLKTLSNSIDNCRYAYLFCRWYAFHRTGKELDKESEKRFLHDKDYEMVKRMQELVNSLSDDRCKLVECEYRKLEVPFFLWHDRMFVKSNSNDILEIATGRIGKIPADEKVLSVVIFGSFSEFCNILDVNYEMQKHFKEMGW